MGAACDADEDTHVKPDAVGVLHTPGQGAGVERLHLRTSAQESTSGQGTDHTAPRPPAKTRRPIFSI